MRINGEVIGSLVSGELELVARSSGTESLRGEELIISSGASRAVSVDVSEREIREKGTPDFSPTRKNAGVFVIVVVAVAKMLSLWKWQEGTVIFSEILTLILVNNLV